MGDIWEPREGESAQAWVERITPFARAYFRGITDPGDRMEALEAFAHALDVPKSAAFRFLMSDAAPDTREPGSSSSPGGR